MHVKGRVVTAKKSAGGQLPLEARHQVVQLFEDGANGIGLCEIDAGFLQLFHRIVIASRLQEREIARACVRVSPHDLARQARG